MKYGFVILVALFISLVIPSCSKDKTEQKDGSNQINSKQLLDCYNSQNYDSTKLAAQMIGTWKWTTSYAEMSGTTKADKAVFLNLTQTGTYTVTENSVVISQGNWRLKYTENNGYHLVTDGSKNYIYGMILLCEDQLLFGNSYVDGPDNLFEKTK